MGLPADFQPLHSSLCLHIWLLLVRLRAEGKPGKQLAQMLYDDFQTDVEERARAAGVRVRLSKQLTELEKQFYGSSMAYDKALAGEEALDRVRQAGSSFWERQCLGGTRWGCAAAFDRMSSGCVLGGSVLPGQAANHCCLHPHHLRFTPLFFPSPCLQALLRNVYSLDEGKGDDAVLLARYVRRELACLTMTPSEAVMAGNLKFSAEGLAAAANGVAAPASAGAEGAVAGAETVPSA
jgi:hypothetical protein